MAQAWGGGSPSLPRADEGAGQGRGPLGIPTPALPSKEPPGSRYRVEVLFLVEGMGEADERIQGPKPKCL